MKLWQKGFFAGLLLVMLGLDVFTVGMLWRSNRLNERLTIQTAETEMQLVKRAITGKLSDVARHYEAFTALSLAHHLQAYSDLYSHQQGYFQVTAPGGAVYSSLPEGTLQGIGAEEAMFFHTHADRLFLVCVEPIEVEAQEMQLLYMRDVTVLSQYRAQLRLFGLWVTVAVSIAMGLLLLLLFYRLLAPLRRLNEAARAIAQGEYAGRVPEGGRDEAGELAVSFNRMAAAVAQKVEALEEASQQRQRFIDNLSHELRTPVTAIIGYGELLHYANITQEAQETALTYIVEQGKRIQNLSQKLLTLARLRHEPIALDNVPLAQTARAACRTLHHAAEAKGVAIEMRLADVSVEGDAALLETLVLNLLENALHASGAGQRIVVSAQEAAGGGVCLRIRDEGIGIAPQEQAKVLAPFYRVHPARSRANGGAGLGLALCQEICALHGASLAIDSAPEKGTAVSVEFTTPQQAGDVSVQSPPYDVPVSSLRKKHNGEKEK